MIATRRLAWSYSLDRAVEHATRLSKPLLIFEPLNAGYCWASDRRAESWTPLRLSPEADRAGVGGA